MNKFLCVNLLVIMRNYTCKHIPIYLCTHIHTEKYAYAYIYIYTNIHISIYTHTVTHTHTHTYTYTHTIIYIYIYIYIYIHLWWSLGLNMFLCVNLLVIMRNQILKKYFDFHPVKCHLTNVCLHGLGCVQAFQDVSRCVSIANACVDICS